MTLVVLMIDYCNPFVKWSYIYNKECALHILAPAAVACDTYLVRRSAHP